MASNNNLSEIKDLHNKIKAVDNFLGQNHDSSCYIKFTLFSGSKKEGQKEKFELDTRDKDSFKHYAISLKNQRTGCGSGNLFTLTIAYHADFAHVAKDTTQKVTINQFEAVLSTLVTADLVLNGANSGNNINYEDRNRCILEYGYMDASGLPKYVGYGFLLKYNVNANKQIVTYTLSGYSGEQREIGYVNWYPNVKDATFDENGNLVAELYNKNTDPDAEMTAQDANDLITILNQEYVGLLTMNPYKALDQFITEYNDQMKTTMEQKGKKFNNPFKLINHTGNKINNLTNVALSLCRNQTALDYIKYIVSMFQTEVKDYGVANFLQTNNMSDRWVYYIRQLENGTIEIHIDALSSDNMASRRVYEFKTYHPNNNLLISYDLNYDGTVALTVKDGMSDGTDEEESKQIYINNQGLLTAKASVTRDMFVSGAEYEALVQNQNTWLDRISCANNCSMTTFGLPMEIPVGTIFKITSVIGNTVHHTSGDCFVSGITDNISGGKFTTQFSMIRLPGRAQELENVLL